MPSISDILLVIVTFLGLYLAGAISAGPFLRNCSSRDMGDTDALGAAGTVSIALLLFLGFLYESSTVVVAGFLGITLVPFIVTFCMLQYKNIMRHPKRGFVPVMWLALAGLGVRQLIVSGHGGLLIVGTLAAAVYWVISWPAHRRLLRAKGKRDRKRRRAKHAYSTLNPTPQTSTD